MTTEKIKERILNVCYRITREGKGALIVLGGNPKYIPLIEQKKSFDVFDDLFEFHAGKDGAMIVDETGIVQAYQVSIEKIENVKPIGGGTRHLAGVKASLDGGYVYLVSQEQKKIEIIIKGEIISTIDPFEKDIEKKTPDIIIIIESTLGAVVGYVGTTTFLPFFGFINGVVPIAGLTLVGSAGGYYLIRKLTEKGRLNLKPIIH